MNAEFTVEQGLAVQARQLEEWSRKLKDECFAALKARVEHENSFLGKDSTGYDVFRGEDLATVIAIWPKVTW